MSNGIFLLRDGELLDMREQPYDSEDALQELLEKYPKLLVGDHAEPGTAGWLLIRRELGVPGEDSGADRWSLDHLFVDRDGVPTLVEVKRSADSRIRREVVGQMLDYAANGVRYWPQERLRAEFEGRCVRDNLDPEQALTDTLGSGIEAESFWGAVEQNLRAGRVRMVFVADVIPVELRRVIEFLNDQMSQATDLGIEVRQYVGEGGSQILVPQIVGQTEQARAQKIPPAGQRAIVTLDWPDYERRLSPEKYEIARQLFDRTARYVEENGLPWTAALRRGYIAFQRAGEYNVLGIALPATKPVDFSIKLPASIEELQAAGWEVENPYPNLEARWDSPNKQIWWAIPSAADVPDVAPAIDICRKFQPVSGPMP